MVGDEYSAVWVSHSSMGDYIKCPRLYYLNNVYRNPKTGNKITLMSPPLALGQAVHEVVESLSVLTVEERFGESLIAKFEKAWEKVEGERGGFASKRQEKEYKERGAEMLRRVMKNPGPLKNKAVKIKQDLPHYWLSTEENIILCGKIDWLEYLPDTNGVHIIDFKTGKKIERDDSLQLPIYLLLVSNCQKRQVEKASYWYLERKTTLDEVELPEYEEAERRVLEVARKVSVTRKLGKFGCKEGGECRYCADLNKIFLGEGKLVGVSGYRQDVFVLPYLQETMESEVL